LLILHRLGINEFDSFRSDTYLPSMLDVIKGNEQTFDLHFEQMCSVLSRQKAAEQQARQRCLSQLKTLQFACRAPLPATMSDLDYARLLVLHLGLLRGEPTPASSLNSLPQLVQLQTSPTELLQHIRSLDETPLRTCDTGFVFYVRKGRLHPQEILNSVCSANYVKPAFLDFLYALGTPVQSKRHFGWTGNYLTSWKCRGLRCEQDAPLCSSGSICLLSLVAWCTFNLTAS
jgi:hypothetical protein